jgi:hypothetical protein
MESTLLGAAREIADLVAAQSATQQDLAPGLQRYPALVGSKFFGHCLPY